MSLKRLSRFICFNFAEFAKGKRFMSVAKQPWKDFDSGKVIGVKVEAVIVQDKTDYDNHDGGTINNLYEKLVFKVPKDIEIPMNVEICPVNPIATVYGEYRNLLSITVDDIEVISK